MILTILIHNILIFVLNIIVKNIHNFYPIITPVFIFSIQFCNCQWSMCTSPIAVSFGSFRRWMIRARSSAVVFGLLAVVSDPSGFWTNLCWASIPAKWSLIRVSLSSCFIPAHATNTFLRYCWFIAAQVNFK